jgi:biopolymer transport protein ExbD
MRFTILILLLTFLAAGCSRGDQGFTNKPEKQITVEITGSSVILLDGKEIHITYFETQIEEMASESELKADVTIHPDADIEVIRAMQKVLRRYSSDIVYDSESENGPGG